MKTRGVEVFMKGGRRKAEGGMKTK
jgi:hypothetical protein